MNTLNNLLQELNESEKEINYSPFVVINLETAAESQRRIAYFQDEIDKINAIVEQQTEPFKKKIEKIEEWGEKAKAEYIEKQLFYTTQLEMYLRREIEKQIESGKKPKKTIKLPYGNISLSKQQPEFQKDDSMLMEYARTSGNIKIKESIDWEGIKKKCQVQGSYLIDENGEIVQGVKVIERPDKFVSKLDVYV